jgi:hypothetical protein
MPRKIFGQKKKTETRPLQEYAIYFRTENNIKKFDAVYTNKQGRQIVIETKEYEIPNRYLFCQKAAKKYSKPFQHNLNGIFFLIFCAVINKIMAALGLIVVSYELPLLVGAIVLSFPMCCCTMPIMFIGNSIAKNKYDAEIAELDQKTWMELNSAAKIAVERIKKGEIEPVFEGQASAGVMKMTPNPMGAFRPGLFAVANPPPAIVSEPRLEAGDVELKNMAEAEPEPEVVGSKSTERTGPELGMR